MAGRCLWAHDWYLPPELGFTIPGETPVSCLRCGRMSSDPPNSVVQWWYSTLARMGWI